MELNVNKTYLLTFDVADKEVFARDLLTLETAVATLKEAELTRPETAWKITVQVKEKSME